MALDSGDLGPLPSSMREMNPACFLVRWPHGIFLNDFEQGDIGPDLFRSGKFTDASFVESAPAANSEPSLLSPSMGRQTSEPTGKCRSHLQASDFDP